MWCRSHVVALNQKLIKIFGFIKGCQGGRLSGESDGGGSFGELEEFGAKILAREWQRKITCGIRPDGAELYSVGWLVGGWIYSVFKSRSAIMLDVIGEV